MKNRYIRRTLKDSLSEIKDLDQKINNVDIIHDLHHKNGGVTFNLNSGIVSGNLFAVSPYIMRSFKSKDLSKRDVHNFIENNLDLLKKENHHVGSWYDPSKNEHFLDISITTPNKDEAIKIGKAANQRSIYDMGKKEVIDIGGTGNIEDMNKGEVYLPTVQTNKTNGLPDLLKAVKESLEKDAGQIKFNKLNHKWTRPEQQVVDITNKNKERYDKRLKNIYGNDFEIDNSGGQWIKDDMGSFAIDMDKTYSTKKHEGFHFLTDKLVEKHGLDTTHKLYNNLWENNVDDSLKKVIHNVLGSNPTYRQLYISGLNNKRHELHYLEEKINLLHDINHDKTRRAVFENFLKENPNSLSHLGINGWQDFDNKVKSNWKVLRDKANSIKKEDL